MKRLYDQGFSHYTMASISRPITDNSHAKTLTSKLYSLKSNLTKEKQQKTAVDTFQRSRAELFESRRGVHDEKQAFGFHAHNIRIFQKRA